MEIDARTLNMPLTKLDTVRPPVTPSYGSQFQVTETSYETS